MIMYFVEWLLKKWQSKMTLEAYRARATTLYYLLSLPLGILLVALGFWCINGFSFDFGGQISIGKFFLLVALIAVIDYGFIAIDKKVYRKLLEIKYRRLLRELDEQQAAEQARRNAPGYDFVKDAIEEIRKRAKEKTARKVEK